MRPRNKKGQFCEVEHDKFHHGYRTIYKPEHPHARQNAYVYEHILVAEQKLGRPIQNGEIIHHIDENKLNNDPNNLMIFKNHKEHTKYHWDHRNHKFITKDGRLLSYDDMAREANIPYLTAYQRIKNTPLVC